MRPHPFPSYSLKRGADPVSRSRRTPFDVFVRASLNPVLVSVSPLFSPSQSLPVRYPSLALPPLPLTSLPPQYVTLSRGARILADTQFETLKQEYKDNFDAIVRFFLPFPSHLRANVGLILGKIIPGGAKGAERLSKEKSVQELIWSFYEVRLSSLLPLVPLSFFLLPPLPDERPVRRAGNSSA